MKQRNHKFRIIFLLVFIGLCAISAITIAAQPRKAPTKSKPLSPEKKALQLFQQKKWALAAQAFTVVLQRDEKNAEFFYKRGFCYSS